MPLCPNKDDEIMAEVRRMRDEYAAKFGYDQHLISDDLRRLQAEEPHKYVSFDKDDPHCVPDTFRYEDFFARSRPELDNVPAEPPDGEE
jgi:hypothetical protein